MALTFTDPERRSLAWQIGFVPGLDNGIDQHFVQFHQFGHIIITEQPVLVGHVNTETIALETVETDFHMRNRLNTGTTLSFFDSVSLHRNVQ